jgi:hypothetical protein
MRAAHGDDLARQDALVVRLVRPDRQAAGVLGLFEGARAPHPAAALAAWKRATSDPNQLPKTLEAVVALFNPEMVPEWRVMDDAELRLGFSPADEAPHWCAILPRDDGTLAAAITAMRLSDNTKRNELDANVNEFLIERFGQAGPLVTTNVGETLLVASSRAELAREVKSVAAGISPTRSGSNEHQLSTSVDKGRPDSALGSGVTFELNPRELSSQVGSMMYRRLVAALNALECARIVGNLTLNGNSLSLEVATLFTRGKEPVRPGADRDVAVQPAWLQSIPSEGAMAFISLAFDRGHSFWDSAFAAADKVERADPARADVAPLRARFNLISAAAGTKPEVELWPHLRGVTAAVMGDPGQPGRLTGALLVLHADSDASALKLASDVVPRLASLLAGKMPGSVRAEASGTVPAVGISAGDIRRLGTVGGRPLLLDRRGCDIVVAWGDDALRSSRAAAAMPERSVAPSCAAWARDGKRAPQRVGGVWPARCWPAFRGLDPTTPSWRALTEGPPAVWWGWNENDKAEDSIHLSDLRKRVHRFLADLPLKPSPLH